DLFAKVSVEWGFTNPEGGDTHYSSLRGTNANLVIRQNVEQNFQATLYVEPVGEPDSEEFEEDINNALTELNDRFPGLSAVSTPFGWKIQIPDEFNESHEEHFTRVMENYLEDLQAGALSDWERTNLLTKYYITTRAYEKSHN
ncbi:putative oxidoreductase C-terminal domain-containing protein, partial [Rhodohalobacter sulfatireducens]